jgi:hypothetical protein
LTTVTDHRHGTFREGPRRTHGRQRIRSFSTLRDSPPRPVLPVAATIPLAKKVLDDPPAKTEKTLPPTAAQERDGWETKCQGVADLARPPRTPGDTGRRGLQNLLLNLYSLVKELPDHSGPAERG